MRFLLDTHAFLWLDGEPDRLSARVSEICLDEANTLLLSLVSVWEMQIKVQLGKLKLNSPLRDVLLANQSRNRVQLLPVNLEHILALEKLPDHHRDPFDRMLVAQTIVENVALLSNDPMLGKYALDRVW